MAKRAGRLAWVVTAEVPLARREDYPGLDGAVLAVLPRAAGEGASLVKAALVGIFQAVVLRDEPADLPGYAQGAGAFGVVQAHPRRWVIGGGGLPEVAAVYAKVWTDGNELDWEAEPRTETNWRR